MTPAEPSPPPKRTRPRPEQVKRAIALGAFFALVGPPVAAAFVGWLMVFVSMDPVYAEDLPPYFAFLTMKFMPIAVLCGVILAIIALYKEHIGAGTAILATFLTMQVVVTGSAAVSAIAAMMDNGQLRADFVPNVGSSFYLFLVALALPPALVCHWLFRILFLRRFRQQNQQ